MGSPTHGSGVPDNPRNRVGRRSPWWVVGASVAIQILLSALVLQSYGAYASVWGGEFGWSKTVLASAFSVTRLESGLMGPVQGWLLQRFGVRAVMRTGLVVLALGYIALSRIQGMTGFLIAIALIGLGVSLAGILSILTIIVNWFEARRATALAVMQLGQSFGGLMVPVVAVGIVHFGWRAATLLSAALFVTIGMAAVQLFVARPKDANAGAALGASTGRGATAPVAQAVNHAESFRDFTLREAVATRTFWLLALGHALAFMAVSAITVHLIVDLTSYAGFTLTHAAAAFSLVTVAAMAGQVLGGVLGDRTDKRRLAAVAASLHVPAFILLAFVASLPGVVAFACLHGLGWGMRTPLMASLRADYFGRSSFPMIMGLSTMLVMAGGVVGPIVTGVVADRTGSYEGAFVLLAASSVAATAAFWWATAPRREPSGRATVG